MVVIAQHCIDAVSRTQGAQQFRAGCSVSTFLGNIVTGKRYYVGTQTIGSLNRPFDLLAAREGAVMNVRKLNNPKTVELTRQASQVDLMVFHRKPERFGQCRTRSLAQVECQGAQGRLRSP